MFDDGKNNIVNCIIFEMTTRKIMINEIKVAITVTIVSILQLKSLFFITKLNI